MKPPCTFLAIQHDKYKMRLKAKVMRTSDFPKTMRIQRKPNSSIKRVWREREYGPPGKATGCVSWQGGVKAEAAVLYWGVKRFRSVESGSITSGPRIEWGDWGGAAASMDSGPFAKLWATRVFFKINIRKPF